MRSLLVSLFFSGAVAVSFAQSAPGSGGNYGTASPGGNPGAGAASGPVLSPADDSGPSLRRTIIMRGGNVYLLSNGKELRLEEKMELASGATVDRRGKVTFKDGREVQLRDGQMVTPKGEIVQRPQSK